MLVTFLALFEGIIEEQKTYGYFMQNCATTHSATFSIYVLNKVFADKLTNHRICPARCPDFKTYDFYTWVNLKAECTQIISIHTI
jgi:hypothetical protein